MIIECKKCKSLFRLDEGLLREEGSKVRCSICKNVFISYPPGLTPAAEKNPRPLDQSLGDTVTLQSPPVLEDDEREPLLEEKDFGEVFEEEAVTRRIQAIPPKRVQEAADEEEFHLEMDFEEEKEVRVEPEIIKPPVAKKKKSEPKPEPKTGRDSAARTAMAVQSVERRPRRSKLPLIILLILILLAGGAGAILYFAPELVPEQLAFLKVAEKQAPVDPGVLRLRFASVTGSFVQNTKAGQLFVVRGAIVNNYAERRSHVLVKGSILDDKGKVVKTKVAYAGNVFSDNELKDLTMDEINQGLRNRAGKGNVNANIQPQTSVPFMIVFEELPENLSEFTVEPVSSSSVQ